MPINLEIQDWEAMSSVRDKINKSHLRINRIRDIWDSITSDVAISCWNDILDAAENTIKAWLCVGYKWVLYRLRSIAQWFSSETANYAYTFAAANLNTSNYSGWYSVSWIQMVYLFFDRDEDWTPHFAYWKDSYRSPSGRYLATNVNYSTPYTPAYPWSPATKKYVDDQVWNIETLLANL